MNVISLILAELVFTPALADTIGWVNFTIPDPDCGEKRLFTYFQLGIFNTEYFIFFVIDNCLNQKITIG